MSKLRPNPTTPEDHAFNNAVKHTINEILDVFLKLSTNEEDDYGMELYNSEIDRLKDEPEILEYHRTNSTQQGKLPKI